MDNFDLNELMDLAEAHVGPMIDAIYRRLTDRDFALEDPEVVMLLFALINVLGMPHASLIDDRIWRTKSTRQPKHEGNELEKRALSGSDLANEPGLVGSRTYQPGEMLLPTKPRPGLRRMHQKMNREAASSSSQLRAAVPPKRARVVEEVRSDE